MEQQAFDQLKLVPTTNPILICPSFEHPFLLQIHASNDIVDAILS